MIVRAASLSEVDTVVDVLCEAFQDDPVSGWIFPDEERRMVAHSIFFRTILRGILAIGGDVDVTDDLSAVVLWSPHGAEGEPDGGAFTGLTEAELGRLGALFELMTKAGPGGEYYHAQFIGVRTSGQRKGLGARLMRHGLDRYSAEGLPAYLEASTPESAKLYRRLGFRDHGAVFAADGGPPMRPMWRDPG